MLRPVLERLVTVQDLDYVTGFQDLASLRVQLRDFGPTPRQLLRLAILETDVGNFLAARDAAEDCLMMDPEHADAWYQKGLATVLLACVQAGAIATGPLHAADLPRTTVRRLLTEAKGDMLRAARANPEDVEARDALEWLQGIVTAGATETGLIAALRGFLAV